MTSGGHPAIHVHIHIHPCLFHHPITRAASSHSGSRRTSPPLGPPPPLPASAVVGAASRKSGKHRGWWRLSQLCLFRILPLTLDLVAAAAIVRAQSIAPPSTTPSAPRRLFQHHHRGTRRTRGVRQLMWSWPGLPSLLLPSAAIGAEALTGDARRSDSGGALPPPPSPPPLLSWGSSRARELPAPPPPPCLGRQRAVGRMRGVLRVREPIHRRGHLCKARPFLGRVAGWSLGSPLVEVVGVAGRPHAGVEAAPLVGSCSAPGSGAVGLVGMINLHGVLVGGRHPLAPH
ncbi:hypothetical protein SEVIR_2G069201v4 [Setaria viridis]|uniref:Uncharacterized protein n=1 Tax=Setaria viridis TaxID=4556 RepID=A0A4V6Y8T1_SETVI|nr:hypothetical protein SEVIR_2G069201v2 [Setaria viridis]